MLGGHHAVRWHLGTKSGESEAERRARSRDAGDHVRTRSVLLLPFRDATTNGIGMATSDCRRNCWLLHGAGRDCCHFEMTGGGGAARPIGPRPQDSDEEWAKRCEEDRAAWGCPPACRCEAAKLKYIEAVQGADASWKPPAAAAATLSTSGRVGGDGGGDDEGNEGRSGGGGGHPQQKSSSSGMGPVFSSFAYDEAGDDQVGGWRRIHQICLIFLIFQMETTACP